MSKNHKTWKKLLPCLALAAILTFATAMRFPADAISPKPATIQASTGDYFNLAYEKTLEFVQPLWEKIKLFTDQPQDWSEVSQNLIKYAKEKPLMAAAVGAGVIWIPFGLFRAFRSRNEEEENSEYDEFMNSEFEEEDEDYEEEDDYENDEEEYQKNLREFNEDGEEDGSEHETAEEEAKLIEEETAEEEVVAEAALLEEEETPEEEVFEDFESESLEDPEDDFGFLEEDDDENESLLFQDEEDDEFAALREEDELSEDDEFSDIFSESTSDSELVDSVPAKDFSSDSDSSDDVLKKLENEFASLEREFSEVDDFIDEENKKNEAIGIEDTVDSGSEKVISNEGEEISSEIDQLLSASESLSNLENQTSSNDLASDPFENKELPSNIMDIINKEAVMSDPASTKDSSTPSSQKIKFDDLEDEEELDQTLKDLQAEMEQTIQEISAQIDSEPQYESQVESEDFATSDVPSMEESAFEDLPFESVSSLTEEDDDEPTLDEILKQAEEEAEKELKDLLPESSVFLEEEANESTIEEEIPETQTIPDTVEETFKDVFAEALDSDPFQEIESEEEPEEYDLTTAASLYTENLDAVVGLTEDEPQKETKLPPSILAEEKPTEFPDLTEESPDAFDPLLPALDAATHEEIVPKPKDKSIDPVKANSYIKSLGAFQKNLENRLNTLKYFPPIEDAKPPTPKVDEFEIGEPILAEEPDIDFDHIGESPEKKYSLELMESFILLDNQK